MDEIERYARELRAQGVPRAEATRLIKARFGDRASGFLGEAPVTPPRPRPQAAPAPEPEEERGTLSNVARGLATGVAQAGTTTLEALGTLTGSERLKRYGEEATKGVEEYFDPEGTAGAIARGVGRIGGEIGTSLIGGGALLKGATAIPKVGTAIKGATTAQKALAAGAAQLPIDVLQGAKEEEGLLLPGRAGAIAESVGLGAIGTGIAAARSGRRAAQAAVPPVGITEVADEIPAAPRAARAVEDLPAARETGVPKQESTLTPALRGMVGDQADELDATLTRLGVPRVKKTIEEMVNEGRKFIDGVAPGAKTRMTDEEFAGRSSLIAEYEELLGQVNRRLADEDTLPVDRIQLEAARNNLFDNIVREVSIVQPALSSAAVRMRTARQFGNRDVTSAVNAARSLIGLPPQVQITQSVKDEIRAIFNKFPDPEARKDALQEFYSTLVKRSPKELIFDTRKVSLLSNPVTWLVNIMGSSAESGQEAIAHPIALGMDKAWSALTGQRRTIVGTTRTQDWLEAAAKSTKKVFNKEAVKRTLRGIPADDIYADDLYKQEVRPRSSYVSDFGLVPPREGTPEAAMEPVTRRVARFGARVADIVANGVFGIMEGADVPFYRAALAVGKKERAAVRAINEGLKPGTEAFTNRVRALVTDPNQANFVDNMLAAGDALDVTFKSQTGVSRAINTMGGPLGAALQYAVPFANTPTNIVRRAIENLPVVGTVPTMMENAQIAKKMRGWGATADEISDEMRRRFTRNLSKQVTTGVGGITVGYLLHQAGMLTPDDTPMQGATPEEREEMKRRQLTGEAPLSLKFGDESYSLSYLGTLAPALALGAAFSQAQKDDVAQGLGTIAATATKATARTFLDMPLLQGAKNLIDTFSGPPKKLGVRVGREVGTFVPSAVAALGRGMDVTPRRTPETFGEAVMERVPVLREQLAPTPGPFGEMQEGVGVLRSLFDPTRPRKIRTGGIYDQLQQLEVYPGQRARRPEETAQAYFERRQREGEQEKAVLEGILSGERPSLRNVSASARKEFRRIQREQGDEEAVRQLVGIALRQQRSRMSAQDKKSAERQARREGLRPSDPTFDARVRQLMAGQP
jgi:hypothetical protein